MTTTAGDLNLKIPKLRNGSFFPALLERRRRVDPPEGQLLSHFIHLISAIFSPVIWPLAASGLLKAFLSLATHLGVLDPASQTNVILAATADALFYFLPFFLGVTAAKKFKANQFTSMAIAGALVYPSIVALAAQPESVSFAGIPVVMMNYTTCRGGRRPLWHPCGPADRTGQSSTPAMHRTGGAATPLQHAAACPNSGLRWRCWRRMKPAGGIRARGPAARERRAKEVHPTT